MDDLILDRTIRNAGAIDFRSIPGTGLSLDLTACLDLFYGTGLLGLTHVAMESWVVVTPELVRIAVPEALNVNLFREGLAVGGALRNALVELRCAAIVDRGTLAACCDVNSKLQSLTEQESIRSADRDGSKSGIGDPVFEPYSLWFYGIERKTEDGKPQVLAFPLPYVGRAREVAASLAIYDLDDLLEMGLSPVTAKIGVPKDHAGYEVARREWIELAIKSLVADIQEAIKGWPVLPGEPFQNIVLIDDHLYFITLDTFDGVTVASATASKDELTRFSRDVTEIGCSHLAKSLTTLRRASMS